MEGKGDCYMRFRILLIIVVMLIGTVLVGCNSGNQSGGEPLVKQINSFYPEGLSTVDRIEMLRSDGERVSFANQERIQQWLDQIGEVEVTIDSNPEDHSGSLFIVSLFEKEEKIFFLTPTSINGTAISANQDLADRMSQLWVSLK